MTMVLRGFNVATNMRDLYIHLHLLFNISFHAYHSFVELFD